MSNCLFVYLFVCLFVCFNSFAWALGGAFLGTYAVVQDLNIPLILQPQIFGTLSLITWAQVSCHRNFLQRPNYLLGYPLSVPQCQYYTRHWSLLKMILIGTLIGFILGGFEAGTVFALGSPYRHGNKSAESGVFFFGIMSTVFISGTLVPQYYEIYKHGRVIGLSIPFIVIDLFGGESFACFFFAKT
jgi:hypothetical protein